MAVYFSTYPALHRVTANKFAYHQSGGPQRGRPGISNGRTFRLAQEKRKCPFIPEGFSLGILLKRMCVWACITVSGMHTDGRYDIGHDARMRL